MTLDSERSLLVLRGIDMYTNLEDSTASVDYNPFSGQFKVSLKCNTLGERAYSKIDMDEIAAEEQPAHAIERLTRRLERDIFVKAGIGWLEIGRVESHA